MRAIGKVGRMALSAILGASLLVGVAHAQGPSNMPMGGGAMPAMTDTTESHLAIAKWYDDKTAEYRKEADMHRHMLESYKAMSAGPAKSGLPNPWVAKMAKHCQMFIDQFDRLANEAQEFAAFERSRANELKQK